MNGLRLGIAEAFLKPKDLKYVASTSLYTQRNQHSDSQLSFRSFEEIPGPKPLPVIGSLWRYSFIGDYSFEKIQSTYFKMYQQYGPLVKEKLFGNRVIVHVFDPRDVLIVFSNQGDKPMRVSHQALGKYREDRPSVYNSAGLFPSNGEEWLRFRRLFQKIILSPQQAEKYQNKLEDVTEDMVKKIARDVDERGELDIQLILFNWAIECIGVITLNWRLGCLSPDGNKEALKLVKAAQDIHQTVSITENFPLWKYVPTPSYAKLVSAMDFLERVVKGYLAQATKDMEGMESDTLLSKMLKLESADEKDIFTMILDLFLAGIDTTAYTTAFALYNLAINPDVQDKLYQHLITQLPSKDSSFSEKKSQLRYLRYVMKESLRMNPVSVGNGRVLTRDLVLSGYNVPEGTFVMLQHQVASRLSKNFTDADKFFPDRWDKSHPYNKEINHMVSVPFGHGPRACAGRRYAELEMLTAIGKVVRNYKISYHYDPVGTCNRLINVPDKPVMLRFQAREN